MVSVERLRANRRANRPGSQDWHFGLAVRRPTVALALARIRSQDKDVEAAGITVYATGDLFDAIQGANSEPA
jgi:hypothetical protein